MIRRIVLRRAKRRYDCTRCKGPIYVGERYTLMERLAETVERERFHAECYQLDANERKELGKIKPRA